jgi:hypothetical protein
VEYRLTAAAVACAFAAVFMGLVGFAGCSSVSSGGANEETPDAATPDAAGAADATVDAQLDAGVDAADLDGSADAAGDDGAADASDCAVDLAGEPTELRCTGLYSDWASRTVAANVQVYDPGLHLWSDGAVKTRWVYLPPGEKIDTSNMDEWTFPVGTKFWKQFVVNGALVETRLLHKISAITWYPTTYYWAPDGSSATELTTGALNVNDAGYEIPSQSKCTQCHPGRADFVLGFEAVSLSSPGASGLPIGTLTSRDLLTAPPAAPITIPGTATESAALGYLHSNCGITCHNSGNGLAGSTGFFMRLNVSELASVAATDTYMTGWNVATKGFHVVSERIAQCSTDNSCVYYRMSHRDGEEDAAAGTQMPPIDTHKVDPTGEALLAAWINEGCDAGP